MKKIIFVAALITLGYFGGKKLGFWGAGGTSETTREVTIIDKASTRTEIEEKIKNQSLANSSPQERAQTRAASTYRSLVDAGADPEYAEKAAAFEKEQALKTQKWVQDLYDNLYDKDN